MQEDSEKLQPFKTIFDIPTAPADSASRDFKKVDSPIEPKRSSPACSTRFSTLPTALGKVRARFLARPNCSTVPTATAVDAVGQLRHLVFGDDGTWAATSRPNSS